MGTWRKHTREIRADAVLHSTSVNGVLRHLGLNQAGGTHFVRYQNGAARVRLTAGQILVRVERGSKRTKPPLLRRALAEIGRPYACEACANEGRWCGSELRLEIDHIDGDFHNNEASNLRYLCPNCHAQTANFSGRSRGKYAHVRPPGASPESRP
jgi:hypothetical protein